MPTGSSSVGTIPDVSIEGRTLSEVAQERGQDPIGAAVDLILSGGPSIVSYNMHDSDIETLMVQPWTMTSSDGGLVPMNEGGPPPALVRRVRPQNPSLRRREGSRGA